MIHVDDPFGHNKDGDRWFQVSLVHVTVICSEPTDSSVNCVALALALEQLPADCLGLSREEKLKRGINVLIFLFLDV